MMQNAPAQIPTTVKSKVVSVEASYGMHNLSVKMEQAIDNALADGWMLFAVNTVNGRSTNGTGNPATLLTFLRDS